MDYDIISMEHLLLALVALVSFVRSHLRLYHRCIILIKRYFAHGNHFCSEDPIYYIPWPWTRNATLFYRYLFRGRPIPRKHDPYIQAWHPLFWNWNVSIRMRSEICAPGICMIRNVFEGFYSILWPFTGYFGSRIVEAGSLKTLKRIVEKCNVSGWKRKSLQGLIEWNLESDTVIGDMDIEKYR